MTRELLPATAPTAEVYGPRRWRPRTQVPAAPGGKEAARAAARERRGLRKSRPAPRAKVIWPEPLSPAERAELQAIEAELRGPAFRGLPVVLPTKGEPPRDFCKTVPRPCPFVSCPMNNYLDRLPEGRLKLNFAHLEPGEMDPELSCARDVQDRGGVSLEVVGKALNLSMERARQVVEEAGAKGRVAVSEADVELVVGGHQRTGKVMMEDEVGGRRRSTL